MLVRSATFRDLARIEQLYGESLSGESGDGSMPGLSDDRPLPQRTLLRVWHVVSQTMSSLVPLTDSADVLLVAEDPRNGIAGFIQAHGSPGHRDSWQLLNLCVEPHGRGHFATVPLVTSLCNQAIERGIRRVYVRVPLGHPMLATFLEQGFTQYATEQILYRDDTASAPRVVAEEGVLRAARREDAAGLFLLYLRTTPAEVARLEGATRKEWQAAFQQGWMARIGRDDVRHHVLERAGIVAWSGLRPASAARPALIALMCEAGDAALREGFVDAALAQVPPGPLSCVLRHYDGELIGSLQRRGFEIYGTQVLLVRDLAVKVRLRSAEKAKKKAVLATAGLTHGMRAGPHPAVRVLPPAPQGGPATPAS